MNCQYPWESVFFCSTSFIFFVCLFSNEFALGEVEEDGEGEGDLKKTDLETLKLFHE